MQSFYVSIEKNVEVFESYRAVWEMRGIRGVRAGNMTGGINKVIEIEKSEGDELFFVDIVEDDIDFLPQLKILAGETDAPNLIATSHPNEDHFFAIGSIVKIFSIKSVQHNLFRSNIATKFPNLLCAANIAASQIDPS